MPRISGTTPNVVEVRPAVDLAEAEAAVKAEHATVRKKGAEAVQAACRAGEWLAKAQGQLKADKRWTRWLEKLGLPRRTATDYLIVYRERAEWAGAAHLGLRGVLEWLRSGRTGEEDEDTDEGEPEAPAEEGHLLKPAEGNRGHWASSWCGARCPGLSAPASPASSR
jgi:hypothetical protein